MTDYELAALFFQVNANANGAMANYLAVLFGMLATGYVVGGKLDRLSAGVVLVLFTLFAAGMGNEIVSLYGDMGRLGEEIALRGGDGLRWHGVAGSDGTFIRDVVPAVVGTMLLLGYVGTVGFFVRQRGRPRTTPVLASIADPA